MKSARALGRYIFRAVLVSPLILLYVWLTSFIPGYDFGWWIVVPCCLITAFFHFKTPYAWQVTLENYEHSLPPISSLAREAGHLKDRFDAEDTGIIILTSLTPDGLVLFRFHLLRFLSEAAVIPWDCLEVQNVKNNTPVPEGGIEDQNAAMLAEIKIKGVMATIEIPWNKELELYTNIATSNDAAVALES